ncbi:Hypothetical predicted protein [Paramuricea clavata]|uniref:Uncharacterized protein n=1 Tax=Paramuricea clavata TaxID=317549 RepID=A0A6S7ILF0_PARCT|nr:Hypothetical predicted protein [Paramuricea clavata]
MCGKLFEAFLRHYIIKFPEDKKLLSGELQPTRNAGNSPECWYFNELANSTDASPEWTTNAGKNPESSLNQAKGYSRMRVFQIPQVFSGTEELQYLA